MAEAERIIGTPDTPDADRDGQERDDVHADGTPGAGARETGARGADAPAGTSGTEGTAAETERPRGKRRVAVLFAVAAVAYALDLISKMIVVAKLEHHEPIEIIGDWLRFEAIRNAGAAFGFGEAFTVIFTVIAAAVIVVIIRLARKLHSLPWAIALGLLLGGALGNLTDRIFRSPGVFEGAVVDFIAPKHFAVFNLADSAIVCGGILIVLLSFKGLDPDGTVHKD
ncbi:MULTISPECIES: signal peptidase II [Streptomyces]|uniref:Lipoprotein signal peptidase n=1 Tax=Streptomyces fimbriatus TaxID=68197 RepID=A0ABW0DCA1_STRFI|nr:signal peptidase II [Streptomyces sp.]